MKFSFKRPSLNRNWLMLAGAIALGVVATGLSHKVLKDRMEQLDAAVRGKQKMVQVVVAARDLPRGAVVQKGNFQVREIPADYVHSSAVVPGNYRQFAGQKIAAPLKSGEALLLAHLESLTAVFSSTLENGNRALTTEVDEINSISGMLRPTDRIDLMATAHGTGAAAEVTFPLLANVAVLATGQVTRKGEGNNQPHTYTTITLSVSPTDAERIVVAKNSGKLTAVLRNPDDARPNSTPAMNIDDVLPKKPKAANQLAVQYIVGGKS